MINQPVNQLFADLYEAEDILKDLLKNKNMFESKEVNLVTKTNKIIPIGFSTSILQSNDSKFEGVILLFRDLTNLINFRRQMERMERLATLGEVSAGIAHEIRNPLAGIKTSAQVLEESFSQNVEENIKKFKNKSSIVLKITKKTLDLGLHLSFNQALGAAELAYLQQLMNTRDANEGIKAFIEKRPPVWKGK